MESSRNYYDDSRYYPSALDYSDHNEWYDAVCRYNSSRGSYDPWEQNSNSDSDYGDYYPSQRQQYDEGRYYKADTVDQETLMDFMIDYMSFVEANNKCLQNLVHTMGQLTELVIKKEAERDMFIESGDDFYDERRDETKDAHHEASSNSTDSNDEERWENEVALKEDSPLHLSMEPTSYFELPSLNFYLKSCLPETECNSMLIIFHDVSGTYGVRITRRGKPIKYPGNVCGQGAKPP